MPSEIPDPGNITLEQYTDKTEGYWNRVEYIRSILGNHDITLTQDQARDMLGKRETDIVIGFSKITGYQPQEALFQLVQTIACERALTKPLLMWDTSGKYKGKRPVSEELIEHIHAVKEGLADNIFGEGSEIYLTRIQEVLFSHIDSKKPDKIYLQGESSGLKRERDASLGVLASEISEKFPLTSR